MRTARRAWRRDDFAAWDSPCSLSSTKKGRHDKPSVRLFHASGSLSDNAYMADVTIFTAAITAVAGVGGATMSQYIAAIREGRQAKRDRQERYETARREACENLLRAAGDLRTQVANNRSFRGDRAAMTARLEKVREQAAATQLHAVSVGLLAPDRLADPADRLAAAAQKVAEAVVKDTNLDKGWVDVDPDFAALDACVDTFRMEALKEAKG